MSSWTASARQWVRAVMLHRQVLGRHMWVESGVSCSYSGCLAPPNLGGARDSFCRRQSRSHLRHVIARCGKPDLAHVHWGLAGQSQGALDLLGELSVPIVLTEHASRFFEVRADDEGVFARYMTSARHARVVTAVSMALAVQMAQRLRMATIEVLPNAIDPMFVGTGPPAHHGDLRVLMVGSESVKRADIALEGLRRFVEGGKSVFVRLIGPKARSLARALDGNGRLAVSASDWLSPEELACEYRTADVLICTSRYETFGCAPVEAAMCGCALISTRVGVVGELLDAGCGLSVSGTPGSVMEAIDAVWADLCAWRRRRHDVARIAESMFGGRAVRSRLYEVYRTALGMSQGAQFGQGPPRTA